MPLDAPPEPASSYQIARLPASFARDVVLTALAADAYCLGPHWIYDLDRMEELYPNGLQGLDSPRSEYHPGKQQGDFTHYGDQTLVLLESVSGEETWNKDAWMRDWLTFWRSEPQSYLDSATRDVLDAWEETGEATPSESHDLAGASRIAPILSLLSQAPLPTVIQAAREQTAATHCDPTVVDAAEFFTRATWRIRNGQGFSQAFAAAATSTDYDSDIADLYEQATAANYATPEQAALGFGQSCDVSKALPLTIWLALAFERDAEKMMKENALVGGDSSARGMLLALLIAANGDYPDLPSQWTSGINQVPKIAACLDQIATE
ncbi:ADP-ribosylglycohydrolase family protein [Pelagicoccus sp. SDUM812003]|uniref:ADP-ribosylglycohydrolase family protein n=1 Tax=Pelagicoccus sp. SDUM812003 TaxID=3041267 RepID=UPI00280F637C|nr:ADP-ribosylglycohydrolase family protein [Pelagicoccus sp. SDUM812003]MDQ8201801.1 ADP-ribosylglycohydrolase family protein [Pelagicoccus sp. SDUM812003]